MKIVINICFGGFGLSNEAMCFLAKKNCEILEKHPAKEWLGFSSDLEDKRKDLGDGFMSMGWFSGTIMKEDTVYTFPYEDKYRSHPDLIEVVEKLGDAADGQCAKLSIIEIPDDIDFYIHEYDGNESINEQHRSWN